MTSNDSSVPPENGTRILARIIPWLAIIVSAAIFIWWLAAMMTSVKSTQDYHAVEIAAQNTATIKIGRNLALINTSLAHISQRLDDVLPAHARGAAP